MAQLLLLLVVDTIAIALAALTLKL
jgi:hypothetical protein